MIQAVTQPTASVVVIDVSRIIATVLPFGLALLAARGYRRAAIEQIGEIQD